MIQGDFDICMFGMRALDGAEIERVGRWSIFYEFEVKIVILILLTCTDSTFIKHYAREVFLIRLGNIAVAYVVKEG
jgi:hypothetical protein